MRLLSTHMLKLVYSKRFLYATAAILVIAGVYFHVYRSNQRFSSGLEAYMTLAAEVDTAAYIPGIAENPIRHELNTVLVSALTESTSNSKRSVDAKRGLELLEDSEKQINRIGELSDTLATEITRMDLSANSASDLTKKGAMREIVAHAKRRAEIIQDIRGLSYRANFETGKIFKRIQDDEGRLTKAHVMELNSELPAVEEQFNKRTRLYDELEEIVRKIDELYAAL